MIMKGGRLVACDRDEMQMEMRCGPTRKPCSDAGLVQNHVTRSLGASTGALTLLFANWLRPIRSNHALLSHLTAHKAASICTCVLGNIHNCWYRFHTREPPAGGLAWPQRGHYEDVLILNQCSDLSRARIPVRSSKRKNSAFIKLIFDHFPTADLALLVHEGDPMVGDLHIW